MYKAARMRTVTARLRERGRWGRGGGARARDPRPPDLCFRLLLGFSAAARGREAGGRPTMSLIQNLREVMKVAVGGPSFERVLQKV